MEAWIPIHRIAALAHLWGGAGKWRPLVSARSWSILLITHDPTAMSAPDDRLPTLKEAIEAADRRRRSSLGGES